MGRKQIRRHGGGGAKRRESIYRATKQIKMTGRFISTASGGIFFELDADGRLRDDKYFIEADHMHGAINGDTVRVKLLPRGRDAVVTEIIERGVTSLIGIYYKDERYGDIYVEPDDTKLRFTVAVKGNECAVQPTDGDKVEVRIDSYPERFGDEAEGTVTAVFGDSCTREANYSAILHESGIITKFSREAEQQAADREHDILTPNGRLDLRDKTIFTIDGADAKDLDDAISVERNGDGYILGVHIADVSSYVTEGTQLDKEAMERGTSVYFSDKVVPMLPVALSNGICSLNSGLDRYALSAIIELDKFGEIKGVRPAKSIIRSRVRGVYSEVNAIIDGEADEALKSKYAPVIEDGTLDMALALYACLKKKSEQRGALELESIEGKVILDENGDPTDIIRCERGTAEMLIEQFMLCANEAIAVFMTKKALPCVYRTHDKPDPDKVMSFIKFAHNLKLNPPYLRKDNITPGYFGAILDKAKKSGLGAPVSYILLRTMQKAKYSEINSGHFGLSSPCYLHFTSPIRRYPDLATHRILSCFLEKGREEAVKRYTSFAAKAAKTSSDAELRALEAERAIDDLYKTLYMSKHIGEEYEATVSSVTSFGLFCALENTCEGLVPISSMRNRYWYDADSMTLSCGEKVFRLGDRVRIRVESVDIATRRVDFKLLDEAEICIEEKRSFRAFRE